MFLWKIFVNGGSATVYMALKPSILNRVLNHKEHKEHKEHKGLEVLSIFLISSSTAQFTNR
jgi:hypothetical protein